MQGTEYQALAMRTNDKKSTDRLMNKINDMLKKWIFHEKQLDIDHAKKEAGDICWYLAMLCESFGWNLDEIMQINIDKLKARYPEGFDTYRANHRQAGDI